MNEKDYSAENAIKKWAYLIHVFAYIWIALCSLAGLIMLCIDAEYFWWMLFAFSAGGVITALPMLAASHFMYGFGEIVGNSKRMAIGQNNNTNHAELSTNIAEIDESLPEL